MQSYNRFFDEEPLEKTYTGPLRNQLFSVNLSFLLCRSKSLETISRDEQINLEQGFPPPGANPAHFNPAKQRPKTALATMRVPRDLEFSPIDESQRLNQDIIGSLVISSFEFRFSKYIRVQV